MLPSVAGLSLSALRSPVPTGVGVKRQRSNDIAELHVRLADGQDAVELVLTASAH